ncbi:IPT/TIG domain-containing protein [Patescibacteria group bacterium]|nr:IPT/TIG domain-containing protein [Patescibacteria group bacterium]MBU1683274.1 IPT/TIG domain-containing protein [Patescibacteria group bacterium]MBU1935067.1 IPT/TIG domain-containing protein [Patescibacteria group bacterium]
MENTNLPLGSQSSLGGTTESETTNNLQQNMQEQPKKRNKLFIGLGVAVLAIVVGAFTYLSPQLFRAELTEMGVPPSATKLYIPSYEGGPGEEGNISIKTMDELPEFDSITFTLTYEPIDALIFGANPILFDGDTEFQNASFEMANAGNGELVVTIILDDPIEIDASYGINPLDPLTHPVLFKLTTQISPSVATGEEIELGIENLAALNGITQVNIGTMQVGTITVESVDELKVLNAEATDDTHVVVRFSDYLDEYSDTSYYDIPGLTVNTVELGNVHGYDQKTVVLTTDTQAPGQQYVMTADSAVRGNTQGAVDSNHASVLFYGYGAVVGVLSDFGMESAEVPTNSYNEVTITFTDNIQAASVTKNDFTLENITDQFDVPTINSVDSVSGNEVTLTIDGKFLKKNTYLISAVSPSSILSTSGRSLGIDKVAFTGNKNGPRMIGATVSQSGNDYVLQISFDEAIHGSGTMYGHIYETGSNVVAHVINNTSEFSPVISGTTLTLTDVDGGVFDVDLNYAFSVSAASYILNNYNVPVDTAYKTVTFWGYGHLATNTVSTLTPTAKDTIEIAPGSYDFTDVEYSNDGDPTNDNIAIFEYASQGNITEQDIDSVSIVNGNLKIVFTDPLEPNTHYILRIVDDYASDNTIVIKEFVIDQDLDADSAEATAATEVCVEFSENIDEDTVDINDFAVEPSISVSAVSVEPDFQTVCLTTTALTAGQVYYVNAAEDTGDIIYAYTGANALRKSVTAFGGYGAAAAASEVTLSSVDVSDSTSIQLNFSADVDSATMTPVNVYIVKFDDPLTQVELNVTNVTQVSGSLYELTTGLQEPGANYFVIFDGVKDTSGFLLGNARVLNFFGFELPEPTVTDVDPSVVANDEDQEIVLTGQNLDTIQTVEVGNEEVTIVSQSATSLTILIPADFAAGIYNITLVNTANESTEITSALVVSDPTIPMQIVSEESQSIPYEVPNDGVTIITLWVLVTDPVGLANIDTVIVDLSQLDGPNTQEMEEDDGTQPANSQWYTYELTVPATVPTSADPYELPVEVRKGNDTAYGTVSLLVTSDIYQSEAPTIDQLYVSPLSLPPDGQTPAVIYAQVSDTDGIDSISSVTADLGSVGAGFQVLTPISQAAATGDELTTQYFQSEEFTVPDTTPSGQYTISVTAMDTTGESSSDTLSLNVSTELTGPSISSSSSYISPRRSVPNDATTAFSLYMYVTDPDGVGDITSVSASFGTLGISPKTLTRDPDISTEAESAWYSIENLTVPTTAPTGIHEIEIRATDTTGGSANLIMQLDVTNEDTIGDPPYIHEDRGYTTPTVAINDGETPITIYAFVRDDDGDLDSVVINLSNVGQVGSNASDFSEVGGSSSSSSSSGNGTCPTGSNTLVCMTPSVSEGSEGQWFILSGVTINQSTTPSSEPYEVQIAATDMAGKTTYGYIPIYVNNGDSYTNDQAPPEIVTAVATSSTTVEVLFNEEISSGSISSNGSEFTIMDRNNTSQTLAITGATINAAGTIVTLTTAEQEGDKSYALEGSSDIYDAVGVSLVAGASNRVYFYGFEELGNPPNVLYVTAVDTDMIEVEFENNLLPSSLALSPVTGDQALLAADSAGINYNFEIYESGGTSDELKVIGVDFAGAANILQIRTETMKSGQKYRLRISDVASYDGTAPSVSVYEYFVSLDIQLLQTYSTANRADLNGDGVVDFTDFTMFSAVYGTSYLNTTDDYDEGDTDGTVPTTSEPSGGDIPIE